MSHHPSHNVARFQGIALVRATRIVSIAAGTAALTFALPSVGQTPAAGATPAASGSLQPLPPPPPSPTQPPPVAWPPGTPPGYGTTVPGGRMPPGYAPPGYGQPPGYAPPGYAPPGYGTQPGYPPGRVPAQGYPYPYAYPPNGYYPPATLPYVEGKTPPAGYHEDKQMRKGLVIGGAVTFGSAYFLTLLAASIISEDSNNSWDSSSKKDDSKALPLFIPALGPFIGLATLDPSSVGAGWLILDGLAQTAGLAMLIAGFASPAKRWVRDDVMKVEWKLAPVVTGSHTGLGAVGRF